MRGWTKMLLAALLAVAGACGRSPQLTEPEASPSGDVLSPPDGGDALQDEPPPPPADTTGRWGGGLGSGT